jgi:WD40 repeat protein
MISTLKRSLRAAVLITLTALTGLAQKPELVVQTGHTGTVSTVVFSPDGKLLASGDSDGTIKLWDAATSVQLRSFKAHYGGVKSVLFSPDSKTLASGGDHLIRLWDISTGAELRSFGEGNPVALSRDGKTLASKSEYYTIKLWDVVTGSQLHSFHGGSAALSPDGNLLAIGDSTNIRLVNVSTGVEVRSFGTHVNLVVSVAFSPDGKTLASGDGATIKLWDLATGAQLHSLERRESLPSMASSDLTATDVVFSPDGNALLSGGDTSTVKFWEVASGAQIRTLANTSTFRATNTIALSPDGKTLASGSLFDINLWDVATGTLLRSHAGRGGMSSIALSPNGKLLASHDFGGNVLNVWDIPAGTQLRLRQKDPFGFIAFSPDSKMLATADMVITDRHSISLWDASNGTPLRSFAAHNKVIRAIVFSPDGKSLASGSDDTTIRLWDVASGAQLRSLTTREGVFSLAFSPDGKSLASSSSTRPTIELWNVWTGARVRSLVDTADASDDVSITSIAFSPDGKLLASGDDDDKVRLWNVSAGTQLRVLVGHANYASVVFSRDGRMLASGSDDNTVKLWKVATGAPLQTLHGLAEYTSSLAFSFDGKVMIGSGQDSTIKMWDTTTAKVLASLISLERDLISLERNDWMVITPDGLFDGTPISWNKVVWRFNNDTLSYAPVEAFFGDFYYPGLLADIFAGRRPRAASDISQKDRRQARLTLTEASPQPDGTPATRNVTARIDVSQAPAGAQDVRFFRNGALVKLWHGDVLQGKSHVTLETRIPIVAGENSLTAYAFNHDNIKSADASLTVTGAESLKRKGVVYVLAVGVNEYANAQYNLKYAVADALGFAAELKLQQAKLNNYGRVEAISLNDKDATKANILKSLADLSSKVQPEDVLVIFFAGHGTAQQNRFYLIPHDLGYSGSRTKLLDAGLQSILAHSISDEEISRAVEGIDAGQMLLVIDACNSGQALEAEEKRRGPMNSKGLAQLAYEKGMYILTAAQSYQAANEAERYGHGFLTYALVEEGLKTNAADREPRDGQVLLREWLNFATERVPQMQQQKLDEQKKRGRQLDRIKFAEADSGNERSLQRPRVFYRREAEPHPLVVARP